MIERCGGRRDWEEREWKKKYELKNGWWRKGTYRKTRV